MTPPPRFQHNKNSMKRLLSSFVVFVLAFLFIPVSQVHAYPHLSGVDNAAAIDAANGLDCPPDESARQDPFKDILKREEGKSFSQEGSAYNLSDVYAWKFIGVIAGVGQTNCKGDLSERYLNNSVIGLTKQGVEFAFANPPAGTGQYIADVAARAGFVDQAYAQGIGYSVLNPLIDAWRLFRNLTYIVIILVMIFLGVLIMMRKSLDPQTVITIQTALPRVVMTILLITFSYAIAGLVIDLMYALIMLVVSLFGQIPDMFPNQTVSQVQQQMVAGGPGAIWAKLWGSFSSTIDIGGTLGGIGLGVVGGTLGMGAMFLGLGIPGLVIGTVAGSLMGGLFGGLIDGSGALDLFSPWISLIMFIIVAIAFGRIFFMLISAYIQIVLNVVFAPLQLIGDIFPGGHGFMNWITNLIGHMLVYPTTVTLLLLSNYITRHADRLWSPPLTLPFVGSFAEALIGLGIALAIPPIVKIVQQLFKASSPVPVSLGSVFEPAQSATSFAMQIPVLMHSLTGRALFQKGPAPSDQNDHLTKNKSSIGAALEDGGGI